MFEKIRDNLFMLFSQGASSNCYLLKGEKNILIDTGLKENAPIIESAFEELGMEAKDIGIILHTHGHTDHFAADYLFENAAIMMANPDAEYLKKRDHDFTPTSFADNDYFPEIDSILKDGQAIENNSFSLEAIAAPGHTAGCMCFFDKSKKLLFSGDTLFNGGFGRYDLPTSSRENLAISIEKLLAIDFDLLLPGHGPLLKEGQKQNIEQALSALKYSKIF